jgi:hypothetical protein
MKLGGAFKKAKNAINGVTARVKHSGTQGKHFAAKGQ